MKNSRRNNMLEVYRKHPGTKELEHQNSSRNRTHRWEMCRRMVSTEQNVIDYLRHVQET